MTIAEIKDLETRPHHYNKLNYTLSSTSATTPLRVLRDLTSKVPNVWGIFSVISQVASGQDIGDGLTSIINHRLGKYAASLDIKKAYRQIKVSYKDTMLRLSIWFRDPLKREGMVIFRTASCDFRDSQASLALRVAQDKSIASNCQTKLGKLASEDPFADN